MAKKKRKPTKWNLHVTATAKANKGMAFKDVLKKAGKTYHQK